MIQFLMTVIAAVLVMVGSLIIGGDISVLDTK